MASAVTYEMVEDVCNHLAAGGESPTYLKVHQRLGKGSTRIVSAYIRQWREAHALSKALERDPLFGEWPEALQLKARSLFDGLLALSGAGAGDVQRLQALQQDPEGSHGAQPHGRVGAVQRAGQFGGGVIGLGHGVSIS